VVKSKQNQSDLGTVTKNIWYEYENLKLGTILHVYLVGSQPGKNGCKGNLIKIPLHPALQKGLRWNTPSVPWQERLIVYYSRLVVAKKRL